MRVYNRPKDRKHQSKFITSAKAAAALGVHPETLRRWANTGKISYIRGPGECPQRRYDINSVGLELGKGLSPSPGVHLGIPDKKYQSNNPNLRPKTEDCSSASKTGLEDAEAAE